MCRVENRGHSLIGVTLHASESGENLTLEATLPLEAAMAQRVFYQGFIVNGLDALHDTQSGILELIERNLDD